LNFLYILNITIKKGFQTLYAYSMWGLTIALYPVPVYLKTDGTTGQRRDRTEHPSHSWRPYHRPDDKMGRTTGRRDSLTGDDGTSNMFSNTNESTRRWTLEVRVRE